MDIKDTLNRVVQDPALSGGIHFGWVLSGRDQIEMRWEDSLEKVAF